MVFRRLKLIFIQNIGCILLFHVICDKLAYLFLFSSLSVTRLYVNNPPKGWVDLLVYSISISNFTCDAPRQLSYLA